jgi:hypothetical protein
MRILLKTIMIILIFCTHSLSAERKPLSDVDTDALTAETQVTPPGTGDNHVALVWWIPNEFWEAILIKNSTLDDVSKKTMLDAILGVSLLAIVQADITELGAFKYYSKDEIEQNMLISFTDPEGNKQSLTPMKTIDPDLEVILGVFTPILGAAMGNLGNNMHFYVLNDNSETSARLLNPFHEGRINVQLTKRNKDQMIASIEMPLNSLYVPRKCPNGKDAHISWNYCPWTGEPLEK